MRGGSVAPAATPTVSPGCVTEPASAETVVQAEIKLAAASFSDTLIICTLPINLPYLVAVRGGTAPHRYISMISLHVRARFNYGLRKRSASHWSLTNGPTLGPGEDFPQRV